MHIMLSILIIVFGLTVRQDIDLFPCKPKYPVHNI